MTAAALSNLSDSSFPNLWLCYLSIEGVGCQTVVILNIINPKVFNTHH